MHSKGSHSVDLEKFILTVLFGCAMLFGAPKARAAWMRLDVGAEFHLLKRASHGHLCHRERMHNNRLNRTMSATAPKLFDDGAPGVTLKYENKDSQQWIRDKLADHGEADFNEFCDRTTANFDDNQMRLQHDYGVLRESCRTLSPEFVARLLTNESKAGAASGGLRVRHAWIQGSLDLNSDKLVRAFELRDSLIEGVVRLTHAQTEKFISFEGSFLSKGLMADGFHSAADLSLAKALIHPLAANEVGPEKAKKNLALSLVGSKVEGAFDASWMKVIGGLDAYSLEVGNSFTLAEMQIEPLSDETNPSASRIKSASGNDTVPNCRNERLDDVTQPASRPGPTRLPCTPFLVTAKDLPRKASLLSQLPGYVGSLFAPAPAKAEPKWEVPAEVRNLTQSNGRCLKPVSSRDAPELSLKMAKIGRRVNLNNAILNVRFNADSMRVGGDLFMQNVANCIGANLIFANIEGSADLTSMHSADFDLGGATIAKDLRLKGEPEWIGKGGLDLRYAHVGSLDDERDAWPQHLRLDGFGLERVGGFHDGGSVADAIHRTVLGGTCKVASKHFFAPDSRKVDWWDKCWAQRDLAFIPTLYTQLAAAAKNSGLSEEADELRYLGRERRTARTCEKKWHGEFWSCVLQSALGSVAGYGIGLKTFVVLWWVLGATLVGAGLLWWWVPAAQNRYPGNTLKGVSWCLGASLARLLPVIKLNEFEGFFDDPDKTGFSLRQRYAFSILGLVGWILAAILGVAISGLTQGS